MTTRFSRRAFLGSVPALAALPHISTAAAPAARLPLKFPAHDVALLRKVA